MTLGNRVVLALGVALILLGAGLMLRSLAPDALRSPFAPTPDEQRLRDADTFFSDAPAISLDAHTAETSIDAIVRITDAPQTAPDSVDPAFDAVVETLSRATVWMDNDPDRATGIVAADPPLPNVQRALMREIAAFFALRATRDAETYARAMRARGYRPRDDEPWPGFLAETYRFNLGPGERIEDWTVERIFHTWWEREREGPDWPVAVTGVDGGAHVRFAVLRDARHIPHFTGRELPWDSVWRGRSAGGRPQLWRPPLLRSDLLKRDGRVLTARCILGVRAQAGHWYPVSIAAYHDPRTGRWHIESISVANADRTSSQITY